MVFPKILKVRDPAHDENYVDRAVTNDLIGDIHITALHVLSSWRDCRKLRDGGVNLIRITGAVVDINSARRGADHFFDNDVTAADVCNKSIAELRYGLDHFATQHTAKLLDILSQIVLLDKSIFPDLGHHPLFTEYLAGIRGEHHESVKNLWRQRDRSFAVEQQTFADV